MEADSILATTDATTRGCNRAADEGPCTDVKPLLQQAAPCACNADQADGAPCCGAPPDGPYVKPSWVEDMIETPPGLVQRVATELTASDRLGAWRARWGIRRMSYAIAPGLYAVGNATPESPVFVTANYKMSFDRLRSQLAGIDGWILVLDTKGINVWCAAGKGTFGTKEIVNRIKQTRLHEVVSHRQLILPQLGAPGVRAQAVKSQSGFRVVYGPVRAEDLPAFLDAGMKATPDMRRVTFPISDRVALIPIELVLWPKALWTAVIVVVLLAGLGPGFYSVMRLLSDGPTALLLMLSGVFAGAALTPALLPWLPGRAFSTKGASAGALMAAVLAAALWGKWTAWLAPAAWALIILAVASFLGMNFTGASTYTSLSGVKKEMRIAVPIQIAAGAAGLLLWITSRFIT